MMNFEFLDDLDLQPESASLECKFSDGRDGKGTSREEFWPTSSALANFPYHTYTRTANLLLYRDLSSASDAES